MTPRSKAVAGAADNQRDESLLTIRTNDERELLQEYVSELPRALAGSSPDDWPQAVARQWRRRLTDWRAHDQATLRRLHVRRAAEIEEAPITWLWKHRVARGEIAILEGDPETGKTTITSHQAACVTRGRPISPDDAPRPPANVLLVSTEDSVEKVLVPQLRVAGADMSRVFVFGMAKDEDGNPEPIQFRKDIPRLQETINALDIELAVVSPITACFDEDTNTNNDASVRRALTPLAAVAQETDCALLLIRHLNKDQTMKSLYRGGGSIAFMGVARTGLVTGEYRDERVLAMVKNNLADKRLVPAYPFKLIAPSGEAVPRVIWGEPVWLTADDLLADHDSREDAPAREEAEVFLATRLAAGPVPATVVIKEARRVGVSESTLKRAKRQMGVRSYAERGENNIPEQWLWKLP